MENIQNLQINDNFKENADLQVVNFILAQGEKSLQNTIRIADNVTDRAYRLLAIFLPILIPVVVGFFQKDSFIVYTAIFAFIFLAIAVLICSLVIFSYNFKPQAQYVDYLVNEQVFKEYIAEDNQSYKYYLMWVLQKIHYDTEFNTIQNKARLIFCDLAILVALLSLLAPVIAKIIIFYFV
jgi:hypothetical protein